MKILEENITEITPRPDLKILCEELYAVGRPIESHNIDLTQKSADETNEETAFRFTVNLIEIAQWLAERYSTQ